MSFRRQFISKLTHACALAYLPQQTWDLFASVGIDQDTIIDAVEIVRVTGSYKSRLGFNRQPQAEPIDIYREPRRPPYNDNPNASETVAKVTHDYLRIHTKGGLTGFYGAIDAEAITPIQKHQIVLS